MKIICFILLIFVSTFISCKKKETISPQQQVNMRLKNSTGYTIKKTTVISPTAQTATFEELKKDSSSKYISFQTLYKYAYVEVIIDTDTLKFSPIDYVGEEPLSPGRYTFEIGIANYEAKYLSLKLITDK